MLVNTSTLYNYNRCRRFAALNDPLFSDITINKNMDYYKAYFKDIFLSHLYDKSQVIKKNLRLTYEFSHGITLQEEYDFAIEDKLYIVIPVPTKDFLHLKIKIDNHKYQVFVKNSQGIYTIRPNIQSNPSFKEEFKKLFSSYDRIGRVLLFYAMKHFVYKSVNPNQDFKMYFVMLNNDYCHDGMVYTEKLYHIFDFSSLNHLEEMVKIALFRMINHLELKDFTPCELVRKACRKGKNTQCKFVDFCYSHLPKNTSILDFFQANSGFDERINNHVIHYDTYELINNGYVSMQDVPISWLSNQNHLMQRYCVDNSTVFYHKTKLKAGLSKIKFPIICLDARTLTRVIPIHENQKPFSDEFFLLSYLPIFNIDSKIENMEIRSHFVYSGKENKERLIDDFISKINRFSGTIIVYDWSVEWAVINDLKELYPAKRKGIELFSNRVFDLMDIIKSNKSLFKSLGFEGSELETYNFYHQDFGGEYRLEDVSNYFDKASENKLSISNEKQAVEAYLELNDLTAFEQRKVKENLAAYSQNNSLLIYKILKGLNSLAVG